MQNTDLNSDYSFPRGGEVRRRFTRNHVTSHELLLAALGSRQCDDPTEPVSSAAMRPCGTYGSPGAGEIAIEGVLPGEERAGTARFITILGWE